MKPVRVTVRFCGAISGALGTTYPMERRRTIELPHPFTYLEAMEAAREALYLPEGDDPAYECVTVTSVAFN